VGRKGQRAALRLLRRLRYGQRARSRLPSAVTSINSKKLPALFRQVEWRTGTTNADLGAGKFEHITEFLAGEHQVENISFDPFNRTPEANAQAVERIRGGAVTP